jgi:hypothetical protein
VMWFADLLGWGYTLDENLLGHLRPAVRSSLSAAAQAEVTGAAAKDLALRAVAQWVAALAHPFVPQHPTSDAWIAALAKGGDAALLQHFRRVELHERNLIEVVFIASPEPPSHPRFQFDFTTDREGRALLTTCYTVWRSDI